MQFEDREADILNAPAEQWVGLYQNDDRQGYHSTPAQPSREEARRYLDRWAGWSSRSVVGIVRVSDLVKLAAKEPRP